MDFGRYLRATRRRAWIPIALVLAATVTTGLLAFLSKPQYVATATLQARVISGNGAPAPTQTLSLQEVVASHTMALAVIKELKLMQSPADLSRRLRVTPGHSDLFTIAVTDSNPDTAVAIANAAVTHAARLYEQENATTNTTAFDEQVAARRKALLRRFDDAERTLLQFESTHPDATHSPDIDVQTTYQELVLDQQAAVNAYQAFVSSATSSAVNVVADATHFSANVVDPAIATPDLASRYLRVGYAAGFGLLLGLAVIFVLESADRTLREPGSVEDLIGLPVVGVIPLASSSTLRPVRGRSA